MTQFRDPTDDELEAILTLEAERSSVSLAENLRQDIESGETPVGVIDGFSDGMPGYAGRLAVLVWGNSGCATYGFEDSGEAKLLAEGRPDQVRNPAALP